MTDPLLPAPRVSGSPLATLRDEIRIAGARGTAGHLQLTRWASHIDELLADALRLPSVSTNRTADLHDADGKHRHEDACLAVVRSIRDTFVPTMDSNDGGEILCALTTLCDQVFADATAKTDDSLFECRQCGYINAGPPLERVVRETPYQGSPAVRSLDALSVSPLATLVEKWRSTTPWGGFPLVKKDPWGRDIPPVTAFSTGYVMARQRCAQELADALSVTTPPETK